MRIGTGVVTLVALLAAAACGKADKGDDKDKVPSGRAPGGGPATAPTGGEAKRELGVEAAKIVFALDGVEVGTQTVWIDGWGSTVLVEIDTSRPRNQTTILWRDRKNASWNRDPAGDKRVVVTGLRAKATELAAYDDRQLEMGGYVKQPDDTVAGVATQVWRNPANGMTQWIWKGTVVRSLVVMGDHKIDQAATSIEEGVKPPADKLAFPDGYAVKDLTRK